MAGLAVVLGGCANSEGRDAGSLTAPTLSAGGGIRSDVVSGHILFPNAGLNAIQEFDPATRQVVQTIPLPTGYTYSGFGSVFAWNLLIRRQNGAIFANAQDIATGSAVVISMDPDGTLNTAIPVPAGAGFLQQMAFDPLDLNQRTILGGVPFLPGVASLGPAGQSLRIVRPGLNAIGLVTDPKGRIYVGNYSTGELQGYTADGSLIGILANVYQLTGNVEINAIARDGQGNLYLTQNSSQRIVRLSSAGVFLGYITNPNFFYPAFVHYNADDGLLYVGNTYNDGLTIVRPTGDPVAAIHMGGFGIGSGVTVP